jgi:hypothetical protein
LNDYGQLGNGKSDSKSTLVPVRIGVRLTQISSTASNVAGLFTLASPTVSIAGSPDPATTGPVAYDVTVSGSGATPSGTVTVSDGTGDSCTGSRDISGSASCTLVENATDSPYTVTAVYSGDDNYSAAAATTNEIVLCPGWFASPRVAFSHLTWSPAEGATIGSVIVPPKPPAQQLLGHRHHPTLSRGEKFLLTDAYTSVLMLPAGSFLQAESARGR